MDLFEARRRSLLALIETKRFAGVRVAFCDATGISPSYLSRMLKEPGQPNGKRIGDEISLMIERKLDLPAGVLLNPAGYQPQPEPSPLLGQEAAAIYGPPSDDSTLEQLADLIARIPAANRRAAAAELSEWVKSGEGSPATILALLEGAARRRHR